MTTTAEWMQIVHDLNLEARQAIEQRDELAAALRLCRNKIGALLNQCSDQEARDSFGGMKKAIEAADAALAAINKVCQQRDELVEVVGRLAKHEVVSKIGTLDEATWERNKNRLQRWKPESGKQRDGFTSKGNARRWITKLLKKEGWPDATQWEIWEFGPNSFGVYMVVHPK